MERRKFHAQQQYGQQDRGDQNKFNPKHSVSPAKMA
jgi:hypothetical protein